MVCESRSLQNQGAGQALVGFGKHINSGSFRLFTKTTYHPSSTLIVQTANQLICRPASVPFPNKKNIMASTAPKCRFLDLPTELRLQVYELLLVSPTPIPLYYSIGRHGTSFIQNSYKPNISEPANPSTKKQQTCSTAETTSTSRLGTDI